MEFSVTIELGNDEMRTAEHVSRALAELSEKLSEGWDFKSKTLPGTKWPIHDINGNRVGTWTVTGEPDEEEE